MGNMTEGLPDPSLAATGMTTSAARRVADNIVKMLDGVSARSAIDVQIAVDQLAYALNLAGLDQDRLTQMGRAANRARGFLADQPVQSAAEQPGTGASALRHYKLAELWAFKAEPGHASARGRLETAENCAAVAQVHATLALAGISALQALVPGAANITSADHRGWKAVASEGEHGHTTWHTVDRQFGEPGAGKQGILFFWSNDHGPCQECGVPAAFLSVDCYGAGTSMELCAVCAANAAADGAKIERIDKDA